MPLFAASAAMSVRPIPGFAEPVSSLSHLIGAAVFALLSWPLLRRSRGNAARTATLALFCVGTVLQLSLSGAYHLSELGSPARRILQQLDRAAIFALIASSFTPSHVILFRGVGRWGVLLLVWTFAVAAISFTTIYFAATPVWLSLSLYLGMGWIGLYSGGSVWRRFGFDFAAPILWGGVAYSLGALLDFFNWPLLAPGVVRPHEVFHVAVLIGLAFHWSFAFSIADGRLTPPPREDASRNEPEFLPYAAPRPATPHIL